MVVVVRPRHFTSTLALHSQLIFTRELQRRLGGESSRALVLSVHPGLVPLHAAGAVQSVPQRTALAF